MCIYVRGSYSENYVDIHFKVSTDKAEAFLRGKLNNIHFLQIEVNNIYFPISLNYNQETLLHRTKQYGEIIKKYHLYDKNAWVDALESYNEKYPNKAKIFICNMKRQSPAVFLKKLGITTVENLMNQITAVDLTENYLVVTEEGITTDNYSLDYIPYKEILTSLIKEEDESNN